MVVLDTSFKELKKQIGREISEEELDNILFDMGMELESLVGDELKISITTDRVDMLSLHGLARALRAYLKITNGMPIYHIEDSSVKIFIDKSVENVRPYTVAAVVDHLQFTDEKLKEIIWVQEKLHQTFARGRKKAAIGIYPMDKITSPIDYFAEDPTKISFLALGANKEMTGKQILEEHSTGKEFAHLLEGKKKFPFFKDAQGNILSMPPIINSELTGRVTLETKSIFIECSGSDFNAIKVLLNILVAMFQDMGGKIKSVELNYPDKKIVSPDFSKEYRTIYVKDINKILGTDFMATECKALLERMMYNVTIKDEAVLEIEIPPFRTDIWHDIDIIDDVGRAYGFNKLEPTLTLVQTTGGVLPTTTKESLVKTIMVGLGYNQSFTLALTSKEDQFDKMNVPQKDYIRLGLAAEKSINMMRINLMPELIKFLSNNRNKPYPQKVFEINDVVIPNHEKDVRCENKKRLAIVLAHPQANFTEIKQVYDYLIATFSINAGLEEIKNESFIDGRCAQVLVDNKHVGYFGEIHPQVLENFGIEMPMCALEMDFDVFM